jgi:putative MATE family efflux protein
MGAVGFFSSRWLLELLGTPDSIINVSEIYMKISFAGVLGMTLYNGIAGVLRALGDSVTPLIFLIIASITNVVLDLVFVVYFQWGVPGVAVATIISQFISAIGCIIYAYVKVKILRMPLKEFVPERDIFNKCIRLGVPVAIQNGLISVSMSALQGVVNSYNEVVIAANTVASRIEQLVLQPGSSVSMALAAYAGQNIGAGLTDRVKKGFKSALIIIVAFSLLMLPAMYFGGEYIMRLFTKPEDYEVVKTGIIAIRITCFFYPFVGIIFITRNFLSGVGDIKIPLLMGVSEVIFRISFVYLFTAWFGFKGIWWATAINWVLTAAVGMYRVSSGKWKDKAIVG